MSAPSRGRGRGSASTTTRGRGNNRANSSSVPRGRGRGRGGSVAASTAPGVNGTGLLQQLRNGTFQANSEDGARTSNRGRGKPARGQFAAGQSRGSISKSFNTPQQLSSAPRSGTSTSTSKPNDYREFMAQMTEQYTVLKSKREVERQKAIRDGFLADPDKKTSLANAITPVGTCNEMCPEFERVERIVQNMVDKTEKAHNDIADRDMPSEDRMVKRFRRSAAGYDEQLPSDIRTPETLRRTLDYLLDRVIGGGERLASIHKFVWDRTRGIRNDFSIQQVTKSEDVRIAVDCYERIARFHILSLHQLSNPQNLLEGEHFDAHQEREQLNNTLISLMFYYEDHRDRIPLPNEAEFRSYLILFELQALTPDLEERMQSWPRQLLDHPRVQTAFKIFMSAGNTVFEQGPLRPLTPFASAQANPGKFWTILASSQVSYLMACVAEMNFAMVRFTALNALWRSAKSAPQGQQAKNQDWTVNELMNHLGFDDEDQTIEFCQDFELAFETAQNGELYLDFTAHSAGNLDKSMLSSAQIFSHNVVEEKRYRRTLPAVINNVSVAAAIRQGLVTEILDDADEDGQDDGQSLFIPEPPVAPSLQISKSFGSNLNPDAAPFQTSNLNTNTSSATGVKPIVSTTFGQNVNSATHRPVFGAQVAVPAPSTISAQFSSNTGLGSNGFGIFGRPPQSAAAASAAPSSSTQALTPSNVSRPGLSGPATADIPPETSTSKSPGFTFGQPSTLFTPQLQTAPQLEAKSQPLGHEGYVFGKPVQLSTPKTLSEQSSSLDMKTPLPAFSFGKQPPKEEISNENQQKSFRDTKPLDSAAPSSSVFTPAPSVPQPSVPFEAPKPAFTFPPAPSSDHVQSGDTISLASAAPSNLGPSSIGNISPSTEQVSVDFQSSSKPAAPLLPVFNFSSGKAPSQQGDTTSKISAETFSFPNSVQSTTPLQSPKRPSLDSFAFPSVEDTRSASTIQTNSSSADVKETSSSPKSDGTSLSRAPLSKVAEKWVAESVVEVTSSKPDHIALVREAARVALTQPQGLLEYFIGNHISNILQKVVQDYQRDLHETIIGYVKLQHLSRKFFAIWKNRTQTSLLKKRGQQRRQLLAAAMQAEALKKRRNELELEAILAATQETKMLQEEQRKLREEDRKRKQNEAGAVQQETKQPNQITGTKRRGSLRIEREMTITGPLTIHSSQQHKRSRTIDSFMSTQQPAYQSPSSSRAASTAASRFTSSFYGRSPGSSNLRKSLSTQKIDATKTDYFKLKAMGIDPDTPLVPDTADSLAAKHRKRDQEHQLRMSRIRSRRSTSSASSPPREQSRSMPPPPKPLPAATEILLTRSVAEPETSPMTLEVGEDEFLKQLRQAREAMSQDMKWFKVQTAELEKEIEQHEELVRSRASSSVHSDSLVVSTNGLARSNGFEYVPAEFKPGSSLSRTERRIRATGAHGLANRPIGGGQGDYTPVAMSKASALRHGTHEMDIAVDSGAIVGRKRARPEVNSTSQVYANISAQRSVHRPELNASSSPASKRFRGGNPASAPSNDHDPGKGTRRSTYASVNMFAGLDESEESADDDGSYAPVNGGDTRLGDADDDQEYEEEEYEDDGEDEEEDMPEDDDEDAHHRGQSYLQTEGFEDDDERVYDEEDPSEDESQTLDGPQSGLIYPAISRGSTASESQIGPGASLDDAFVLSD